jgi:oligopeptide transport system substrate-binding protein
MILLRRIFPWLALGLGVCAVAWAFAFGSVEPADLTFNNATEIETVDPPKATGQPEGRVIDALFQGLMQNLPIPGAVPNETGITPTQPTPAVAESVDISDDGKTYTFKIRPTAKWSDGRPMTSDDFHWSWKRMLHPETASQYAMQLYYVRGGEAYNLQTVVPGQPVEVEFAEGRALEGQNFPRGKILRGTLKEVLEPPLSVEAERQKAADPESFDATGVRIYVVEVASEELNDEVVAFPPRIERFCRNPQALADLPRDTRPMAYVLPDFEKTVGIQTPDERTLVVELNNSTPFFLSLCAFYPLYPTQRECVERFGSPDWTKPENLVCNGPFTMEFRAIRDRIRLRKNPEFWNAESVSLETVDVLGVQSATTSLNLYETGDLDWNTSGGVPLPAIPIMEGRPDFHLAPQLSVYFYRINVTREPYDDVRVRRALNMAIDKENICVNVAKAGQTPATGVVPPSFPNYQSPPGDEFNPKEARRLIDEVRAEYAARGEKMPTLEILYNSNDAHQAIAQVIQNDWKIHLGLTTELRGLEWASYLADQRSMSYQVSRSGWIADYPDPNTFLDMWVTGGGNNMTGFSDPEYDRLIAEAQQEQDPEERMAIFARAEAILNREVPIIPIYYYVSMNLVKPHVEGFYGDVEDRHPLHLMSVEK